MRSGGEAAHGQVSAWRVGGGGGWRRKRSWEAVKRVTIRIPRVPRVRCHGGQTAFY